MIARPVSAIKRNKKTPQIAAARQVRNQDFSVNNLLNSFILSYSKKS